MKTRKSRHHFVSSRERQFKTPAKQFSLPDLCCYIQLLAIKRWQPQLMGVSSLMYCKILQSTILVIQMIEKSKNNQLRIEEGYLKHSCLLTFNVNGSPLLFKEKVPRFSLIFFQRNSSHFPLIFLDILKTFAYHFIGQIWGFRRS